LRKLIVLIILAGAVFASNRPSVGLVLSGGGARGGAHVGILKYLEEKHIPVDYIVGTSMGSFMGGLYASGYSADELAYFLTHTKWENYIRSNKPRKKIPFRRKTLSAQFPGNIKVGVDANNNITLPTGVFEKQSMLYILQKKFKDVLFINDFKKLPIPYTAVATNLANGEVIPLSSGNIAKSVYASICVPGGFEPITLNGITLVDGGISQNLPVQIMRKLFHPDYIIVVDISTPFDKDKKFRSYDEVMTQQIDILTRKNVEDTIKGLKKNEFLITPELDGYSFLDADKYDEIIKKGYESAKKKFNEISFLALNEKEYDKYRQKHRYKPHNKIPVIDEIEIQNNTYISNKIVRSKIHQQIGKKLDFEQLQKDLMNIYYLMYFSSAEYKVIRKDAKNVLVITTQPGWNVNGDIRAGIAFEDDFNGHSDYQVRFEYNKYNLNSFGGEWRNRVEVGKRRLLQTEIYQPVNSTQEGYVRVNGYYEKVKHYVTPQFLLDEFSNVDEEKTTPLYSLNYGGILGLGFNMGSTMQVEVGMKIRKVNPSTDLFVYDEVNGEFDYITAETTQRLTQFYGYYKLDSLDNPFFPKSGLRGGLGYMQNISAFGSHVKYSQAYGELAGAYSFGKGTLVPHVKFGATLNSGGLDDVATDGNGEAVSVQDVEAYFHLGGLFNISGRPTYYTSGDQLIYGSLNYRYSILSNQFLKSITSEAYIGCSIEAAKTWYKNRTTFADTKTLVGSSVYIAIDTIIGPLYLAYGYSDTSNQTVYFSLGRSY